MKKQLDALVLAYSVILIGLALYAFFGPKHHVMSFAGGLVCGLLEIAFLAYGVTNPRVGRIGSAAVALAVFFMFLGAISMTGPAWNSLTGAIASLIVVLALGYGHLSATRARKADQVSPSA